MALTIIALIPLYYRGFHAILLNTKLWLVITYMYLDVSRKTNNMFLHGAYGIRNTPEYVL